MIRQNNTGLARLRLKRANESPRDLVKMRILTQLVKEGPKTLRF